MMEEEGDGGRVIEEGKREETYSIQVLELN